MMATCKSNKSCPVIDRDWCNAHGCGSPKPPTVRLSARCAHGDSLESCNKPTFAFVQFHANRYNRGDFKGIASCADIAAEWRKVDGKPRKPTLRQDPMFWHREPERSHWNHYTPRWEHIPSRYAERFGRDNVWAQWLTEYIVSGKRKAHAAWESSFEVTEHCDVHPTATATAHIEGLGLCGDCATRAQRVLVAA